LLCANPAICKMLGYTEKELLKLSVSDLHPKKDIARVLKGFREQVKGTRILLPDIPVLKKNGDIIYCNIRASVLLEVDGKKCIVGFFNDITKQKRMQEDIINERNKVQSYLDIAGVILVAIDVNGKITLINKKGCEVLGYKEKELIGKDWVNTVIPKRLRNEIRNVSKRVLSKKAQTLGHYENPVLTKKGEERLISWNNILLKDDRGKIIGHLSSGEDVTEHKKAEEAVHLNREYFKALIENSSDITVVVDKNGYIKYASPSVERYGGYKPEEIISKSIFTFIHPADVPRAIVDFGKSVLVKRNVYNKFRILRKDGSERIFEGMGKNLLNNPYIEGFIMNVHDATERKKAEEALRISEENYRTIFNSANEGIAVHHPETGEIIDANAKIVDIFGYNTKEEFLKHSLKSLSSGKDHYNEQTGVECIKKAMRSGSQMFEWQCKKKNGERFWAEVSLKAVKIEGEDRVLAVLRDITEQKRMRKEHEREHEQLLSIFDSMSELVYVSDPHTYEILYMNEAAKKEWGNGIGNKCYRSLYSRGKTCDFCNNKNIFGKNAGKIDIREWQDKAKQKWFRCIDRAIIWPDGRIVRLETAIDITDIKKLEEMKDKIIRDVSHSLASPIAMARMAQGELARNINAEAYEKAREFQQVLATNLERATKNIDNILQSYSFESKKVNVPKQALSLCKILEDSKGVVEGAIKDKGLNLSFDIPPEADKIMGREQELKLLFSNLIDNAIKFTDKGGIYVSSQAQDGMIEIIVKDTGSGILPKDIGKVFEKFYKRHPAVVGIGLGLSICKEIVARLGGRIEIFSEGEGKGTTVKVWLPRA
ncbi:MAG: PAS domain-containing sensor histidine kinase, partial [Candidatus Omnitrophica bacterium]|nr:PAS domain-containing sensor histidine kinase [Candidatus Omnitrophota bacterium]